MPKNKAEEQTPAPELELDEVKVNENKAPVEALVQAPQTSANSVTLTKKIMEVEKKVKVMIPSTTEDKSAVFASVNGVAFNIPRDKWFEVPVSIVRVLENAKQTTYRVIQDKDADSATVVPEEVSRIAFNSKAV